MVSTYLISKEAAAYIRKTDQTLAYWRMKKIGPKFRISGSTPLYTVEDLEAWMASCHQKKVSPNVGRPARKNKRGR